MANYQTLKAAIAAVIKTNGEEEITGAVMQSTLLGMVESLGNGYQFKGIATPSTVVGTPDENVFYIGGVGTYNNFGNTPVAVPPGSIGIFTYNGDFSNTVLQNDGILDVSVMNATGGTPAKYASLTAALAAIPLALQRGGMTITYIQSSDNKYVQYRLMADEWSTNILDWQNTDTGLLNKRIQGAIDIRNLLFDGVVVYGKYYNATSYDSSSYCYFIIPVTSGTTYRINRARFISKVSQLVVDADFGYYEYTADFTGDLYISFSRNFAGWVVTTESEYLKVKPWDNPSLTTMANLNEFGNNNNVGISQKFVTSFLKNGVSSLYPNAFTFETGILGTSDGRVDTSQTIFETTNFFPVKQGEKYYVNKIRRICYYSDVNTYESYINDLNGYVYTVPNDGFIRFSKLKSATSLFFKKWEDDSLINLKKSLSIDYDLTINGNFVEGHYYSQGQSYENANLCYIALELKAGTYTVYPRDRFICVGSTNIDDGTPYPKTFTIANDSMVYITYYMQDLTDGKCGLYKSSDLIEPKAKMFVLDDFYIRNIKQIPLTIYEELQPLLTGKTIAQFGDSIMAGDGASNQGIGERFASKYSMTCLEYAVGGATMGYLENHSQVLTQVNNAITNGINPDIILFNGGVNDMHGTPPNCPLGDMTEDYTEPSSATSFSAGFESAAYKLKKNFPNAMIIYIRNGNIAGRDYQPQITYGERGLKICEKWGIYYIDMYKRANTQLSEYSQYMTDMTHPNALGYEKYYIPALEQFLYEKRNIL